MARERAGALFVVSKRPLVPKDSQQQSFRSSPDYENLGDLPNSYGRPVLFAIARDPHTIFVYWEVDWKHIFADKPPTDRKVYLRVASGDNTEDIQVGVEPLAGNHTIPVSQARSTYRIELGYYEPNDRWRSILISEAIATPPDDVFESADIDVATIPFHLGFQRLVDAFRGSKHDGEALTKIIAGLQKSADDSGEAIIPGTDAEVRRDIKSTFSPTDAKQRAQIKRSTESFATRRQIESILRFNGSSR